MFAANTLLSSPARRSGGLTLVELMVTVAMLGVLAALAAPSFADMLRNMRVESIRLELQASITNARVEAIARGQPVVLLRTTPCPEAENALDWDCGWTAFVDLNGNGAINAGEPVLHVVQGKRGVRIRRDTPGALVTVSRLGLPPAARMEIFPAVAGFTAANGEILCLARSGRIRALKGVAAC